jgi:signal transduction histidine kinase
LIINGLKYNKSSSPTVSISTLVIENFCVIKVEDNGIGIEEEYIEEIFKPLMRLHNSSEYTGSGLGLTLARKAIMAQGGTIWCESELKAGSKFFVKAKLADLN